MKTKAFILALLLTLAGMNAHAQQQMSIEATLGDSSFVSLLTCGPGDEFYTTFGHTALRVCDSTIGLDVVYNYGTFSFSDGWLFYLRFARGDMRYRLSRYSMDGFLYEYFGEGRWVEEQVLDLTLQERNNLLTMLEVNYLPEYRYYQYDFFRDNCATRVRDMICQSLIHRKWGGEQPTIAKDNESYRSLIYPYMEDNLLWWRFGLDVILGYNTDKPCSTWEYMFAPNELMNQMDTAVMSDTGRPLCKERHQLLAQGREGPAKSVSPTLVFWLLALVVVVLTYWEWHKGLKLRWLDIILFLAAALVSVLIMFLWFFSIHYCTRPNWNLLWASPLFFYFLFAGRRSNMWVVLIQMLLLLVVISGMLWMPQQFNVGVLPLCFILFVRLTSLLRR